MTKLINFSIAWQNTQNKQLIWVYSEGDPICRVEEEWRHELEVANPCVHN